MLQCLTVVYVLKRRGDHDPSKGMKPAGAGRQWVRMEWDPEYAAGDELTPKRKFLNKFDHILRK